MIRQIQKLMGPLKRRVMLMIGRAVLHSVNDSLKLQGLQISGYRGEVLDNVERFQDYGFTSHPVPGAEAILLALGGNRNHSVVIAVDDRRYRLKAMDQGEVALYDDQGQVVYIKRGGLHLEGNNIYLKSTGIVRIEGKGVEIHGRTYYQRDVNGLGERRTHSGGTNWQDDTYTTGAVIGSTEKGLDQPDLPSDHPEGP